MTVARFCGIYSPRSPDLMRRADIAPMLTALRVPAARFERRFFDDAHGFALASVTSPNAGESIGPEGCNWLVGEDTVAYDGEVVPAPLQTVSGSERTGEAGARIIADTMRRGDGPESIAGDFAFAAWIGDKRELHIANEPMGRRSVFYYHDSSSGLLVFASQAKSVLAHPLVPRRASPEGRSMFLHAGFIAAPHTAFEGLKRLMTGDLVSMGEDGILRQGLHWRFPQLDHSRVLDDWSKDVRNILVNDMKATLRGQDRAGILFSAGIDSGLILGIMQAEAPQTEPHTYASGFPANVRNNRGDLPFAQRLAEEWGVPRHTQIEFRKDHVLSHLADAYQEVDELIAPVSNVISINAILDVAREQDVPLCLTGLGTGDLHGLASWWKHVIAHEGGPPETPDGILRIFTAGDFIPQSRQVKLLREPGEDPEELLWETMKPLRAAMTSDDPYDLVAQTWSWVERKGVMFSYCEYITSMHPVKLRHPLAEWRTLKLALQVPSEYKASRDRSMRLKLMLGQFPDMLPQWVRDRTKRGLPGYVISDHDDFPELTRYLLSNELLERHGIFQPEYFTKLSSKKQFRKVLMLYQLWHEIHIERRLDVLEMLKL